MTDNHVDKPDKVVSGDTVAMLYYSQGANSANKQIAELVAENERLKAEIANWEEAVKGDGEVISGLIDLAGEDKARISGLEAERDGFAKRALELQDALREAREVVITLMAQSPTFSAAYEVARVFLDKPDAWARDDAKREAESHGDK